MALFNITLRVVEQTDPRLIALAEENLRAQRLIAVDVERIAAALEQIVVVLQAPEEQVPASATWTLGPPQEE